MSGLVIAYAHWKTNAVGSRYPPCTCRFSNGTTLCQHSGAAHHLFRLFFSQFCKISQISCEFVHFVLISPLQTANAEFGRLSPSTRALICFATKSPHGRKDTSLFPSTRSLIFSAQKRLKSKRPHGRKDTSLFPSISVFDMFNA